MRAVLALMFLGGCGDTGGGSPPGGSALEGIYAVDRYGVDDAGCDGDGDATSWEAPFFELEISSGAGFKALALYACPTEDTCNDDGVFDVIYAFDTFDDDSGKGVAESATHSGSTCFLRWFEASLDAQGGAVEVREETFEAEVSGTSLEDCLDQQASYDGSRACTAVEVLRGS